MSGDSIPIAPSHLTTRNEKAPSTSERRLGVSDKADGMDLKAVNKVSNELQINRKRKGSFSADDGPVARKARSSTSPTDNTLFKEGITPSDSSKKTKDKEPLREVSAGHKKFLAHLAKIERGQKGIRAYVEQLDHQVKSNKKKVQAQSNRNAKLKKENDKLEKTNKELSVEIARLEGKVKQDKEEGKKERKDTGRLQRRVSELEDSNARLRRENPVLK